VGVVLERIQRSRWFQSYSQKLIAIATPLALLLAAVPLLIGFFVPQIATVYLITTFIVVFLTIFSLCLVLLAFYNKVARRLVLIVAISAFLGAVAHYWLLIETIFLGFHISYPNVSAYIAASANLVLLIGLTQVSLGKRRLSKRQIGGYILLISLFILCIVSTYQMNLIFHPPELPAIGTGIRILIGFFTAVFTWTFYFSQDPPREVIGRSSRRLLVIASLILILGYTVFAFQYALGWQAVSTFYYAGSISDSVILLAVFIFLIGIFTLFSEALENITLARTLSIKYEVITRVLLICFFLVAMTLIATIALTLFGRVLLFYLNSADALLGLQTAGLGLLLGFGVVGLFLGSISWLLSRWLFRPLGQLEVETAAVTDPGIIAYTEPPRLAFKELQGISDNFGNVLNEISRIRAEMRRFTITERRLRTPSTSHLAKLDYYLAILNNAVTNRIQTIMSLTEIGQGASDIEERSQVLNSIQTEITQIQDLLKSVQLLRLIDTQDLPELNRIDLGSVITETIKELQILLPESTSQISLSLPNQQILVLANEYVSQIFHTLFRLALQQDVGGPNTIEVTFSEVSEMGIEFWQIDILNPRWVLPDIEKVLLFREDPEQPQKANPSLLLVPALVEYFRGKFRVKDIVIDDPQYGTMLQVLLPQAKRQRPHSKKETRRIFRS
jgi:hypothetical protein